MKIKQDIDWVGIAAVTAALVLLVLWVAVFINAVFFK